MRLDGWTYSPTSKRLGAPRRGLTVWDAISDLPPIRSGHDEPSDQYNQEPQSHLQEQFRASSFIVVDHISKAVNDLCQERINRIPKTPGSDWRDLPNKYVPLVAMIIPYIYIKDGRLTVCPCGSNRRFCKRVFPKNTLIPAHLAHSTCSWKGVYGRADWAGVFNTVLCSPSPSSRQGQVLHPEQDRIMSVREFARAQGGGIFCSEIKWMD